MHNVGIIFIYVETIIPTTNKHYYSGIFSQFRKIHFHKLNYIMYIIQIIIIGIIYNMSS